MDEPKMLAVPLDRSAEFVGSHQALLFAPPPAVEAFSSRYSW